MAFTLEIDSGDLKALNEKLSRFSLGMGTQTAKAMTNASKDAVDAMKAITPQYVDRPTRYTLNAWGRWPGFVDERNLSLWIGLKTTGGQKDHYLRPMIKGGDRPLKRSEVRLGRHYITPTGLAPLRLNSYGNISAASYVQVLSRLGVFSFSDAVGNASGSSRSRAKQRDRMYFVGELRDGRKAIYARGRGRGAKPVFVVHDQSDAPNYEASFPAPKILANEFSKAFERHFNRIEAIF